MGVSVEKNIAAEHRVLDELFAKALTQLAGSDTGVQAGSTFEELSEVLETHLVAEESLYFPTIWALRPEFKDRLRAFIRAHHHFRGLIKEITGLLKSHEAEEAMHLLERFREAFGVHEGGEEAAMRALEEQIQMLDGEGSELG